MEVIDVVVLLLAVFIVSYQIINYLIRKKKKMVTGECSYCTVKSEKMLKKIRKELKKAKKVGA